MFVSEKNTFKHTIQIQAGQRISNKVRSKPISISIPLQGEIKMTAEPLKEDRSKEYESPHKEEGLFPVEDNLAFTIIGIWSRSSLVDT